MTGTPKDRLRRLIRDRAAFVCALGAKGKKLLIGRLQDDYALPAHRNNDEFILLQLGGLIASQMRGSRGASLRQRLEIPNDGVRHRDQPAEEARAHEKIQKITA